MKKKSIKITGTPLLQSDHCTHCNIAFDSKKQESLPVVEFAYDNKNTIVSGIFFGLFKGSNPSGMAPLCDKCRTMFFRRTIEELYRQTFEDP